jgi:hypothetical protein
MTAKARHTESGVEANVPARGGQIGTAEQQFKEALLRSHRSREFLGEVEAAAAHFCRALRQEGVPPERMLVDAKRVIDAASGTTIAPIET